jgi:hypothetical protein
MTASAATLKARRQMMISYQYVAAVVGGDKKPPAKVWGPNSCLVLCALNHLHSLQDVDRQHPVA